MELRVEGHEAEVRIIMIPIFFSLYLKGQLKWKIDLS